MALVKVALGGRAAEEVVFSEQTNDAESDIAQVTYLVRLMVGRRGMSNKIGMVAVLIDTYRIAGLSEPNPLYAE